MKPNLGHLESVFASGPLPIERRFLDSLLSRFSAEMDLLSDGAGLLELIRERRQASEPSLLYTDEETGAMVSERWSRQAIQARAGQFAHLRLSGAMIQEDFLSTRGVQSLAADLRLAGEAANIDGILIEVNTGGGELLAGQTLRNAIKDANAKKPVLVYGHYMASAGIWGTLFAGHIMAAGKGSEFGSIGVYTSVSREFVEAYKERVIDVYSRKSPNKNKDFRSLLAGDVSPLQEAVTAADDIFMADVRRNRPLSGDIDETLAGGMFYAEEAKRRGLVDSIGTFSDAIAQLSRMVRAQKSQNMNKVSFIALAQKFLGIAPETEEAAAEALETAGAPASQPSDIDALIGAVSSQVEALAARVETLGEMAEALRADVASLQSAEPVELPDVAGQIDRAVSSLRAEFAASLAAVTQVRSGQQIAGDADVEIPAGADDAGIDLMAEIRKRRPKMLRHLG